MEENKLKHECLKLMETVDAACMKWVSILLVVTSISVASCAINGKNKMAEETRASSFQPKPLDDEWSKWLVGEWEVSEGYTDFLGGDVEEPNELNREQTGSPWLKAELALNGQYIIITNQGATAMGDLPDEQMQQLKEMTHASDEEIKKFLSMPYKSMLIYTIDTKTGDIVEYYFDSLRAIAEGRGRVEGNKQTTKWQWPISGDVTSVSIRERLSDDKLAETWMHTMSDGKKMEEKLVLTRKKGVGEN